jgi:hypothetical protein
MKNYFFPELLPLPMMILYYLSFIIIKLLESSLLWAVAMMVFFGYEAMAIALKLFSYDTTLVLRQCQ